MMQRLMIRRHTEDVSKKMRSSITSRWAGATKQYAVDTVPSQITAKIDVTIRVLLTVTPVRGSKGHKSKYCNSNEDVH